MHCLTSEGVKSESITIDGVCLYSVQSLGICLGFKQSEALRHLIGPDGGGEGSSFLIGRNDAGPIGPLGILFARVL